MTKKTRPFVFWGSAFQLFLDTDKEKTLGFSASGL